MTDTNKPLFGTSAKPPESQPAGGEQQRPEAEVSEKEDAALAGEAGPGVVPAFGKHGGGEDENNPLTDSDELQNIKEGSAANSPPITSDFDLAGYEAAGSVGEEQPEGKTQYTSHPISRLKIGPHEFSGGVLSLDDNQVADFEKLLKATDSRTQNTVRKIDRSSGEVVAKRFQVSSSMQRGVDTSNRGPQSPRPSA